MAQLRPEAVGWSEGLCPHMRFAISLPVKSKQELWSARLREHAESGVNIRSWCASKAVTEATFHYWRKRLSEASPATQLIALPLVERDGEPMLDGVHEKVNVHVAWTRP
jgi:hypothetical protein